jgi:hypothetical protein
LGWIDWKLLSVGDSKQEITPHQEAVKSASVAESNSTIGSVPTVAEERVQEPHLVSPLISKRMMNKLVKRQEGESKADDTKGTV